MQVEPRFEELREEIETNQQSILWEDQIRNIRAYDDFLWNGSPKATPVQRAGLALYALYFGLNGLFLIAVFLGSEPGDPVVIMLLPAAIMIFFSLRILFNAFRRRRNLNEGGDSGERGE
jgi:hypothetical protein